MAGDGVSVELRERFVEANGYWTPAWQALLDADPGFFATFVELAAVPRRSDALDPKVKELVCFAVNAAATHLFEPGIRAARPAGARARRDEGRAARGAAADEHARHPRRDGRRALCSSRSVRVMVILGRPRGAAARRSPRRAQGRLRGEARLLARASGTACSSSTRTSSRRMSSSRVSVDERRARAEDQGVDLHGLRRVGDPHVCPRASPAHRERARATARRRRR